MLRLISLRGWLTLWACFASAIFLTGWPTYQYVILKGPVALLYYFILGGMALSVIAYRIDVIGKIIREPIFYWFAAYVVAGLVWAFFLQNGAAVDDRHWRLRLLVFFLFFSTYILMIRVNHKIVATSIFVIAILTSINNWIDFLVPFAFVPIGEEGSNPGRGAGFFINANIAGYAVISMIVASFPFINMKYRAWCLIAMILGIFPTFSRSAWIWGMFVAVVFIIFGRLNKRQIALLFLFFPFIVVVGLTAIRAATDSEFINIDNAQERVNFFIEIGDVQDDSAKERGAVAIKAWDMFSESPVVGSGIGAAADLVNGKSTHNMYLLLLAEQGLVGGALYIGFLFVIFYCGFRNYRYGSGVRHKEIGLALILFGGFFAFMGLFSHNLLEEPQTIFLLSFLLAASLPPSGVELRRSNK